MRIGIDLGGTKIEGIALSNKGDLLWRDRIATPQLSTNAAQQYQAIIQAITGLVQKIEADTAESGSVGVGAPGSISTISGMIKNGNTECLNGQPLREDLQTQLNRPIRLANDADCMVLSEASDGAAKGSNSVFGVILGTGVGGGLVINQSLVQGVNGIAGEWGHNPMPTRFIPPNTISRNCYCGAQDCIETWLSGAGLRRSYFESNAVQVDSALAEYGVSVPEIVKKSLVRDAVALRTMDQYMNQLAGALAGVINIIDPEVIVLAGGLSNIDALYDGVPKRWLASVFSDQVATRLVQAQHGDASGARGAAWLWPANETA